MTTEWMNVSHEAINKPEETNIRGIRVEMMISPSDLPKASRIVCDEDSDEIAIEFRYLFNNEPIIISQDRNGIKFHSGKNSGKIYRIVVNPTNIANGSENTIELTLAIQVAEESLSNSMKVSNEGNAKAIRNYFHELIKHPIGHNPRHCAS